MYVLMVYYFIIKLYLYRPVRVIQCEAGIRTHYIGTIIYLRKHYNEAILLLQCCMFLLMLTSLIGFERCGNEVTIKRN